MSNETEILHVIFTCLEELNKQLPADGKLKCEQDTLLVAEDGKLDSLGIITLTVNVEQQLLSSINVHVSAMDALMEEYDGKHPFYTIGSMAEWIVAQINLKKNRMDYD